MGKGSHTRVGYHAVHTRVNTRGVSTQVPNHTDIEDHIRQAWDTYQAADRTRAKASAAVTAALVAGRAAGVSMYRMAKLLDVHHRAVQARLEKHNQTSTPPPPS